MVVVSLSIRIMKVLIYASAVSFFHFVSIECIIMNIGLCLSACIEERKYYLIGTIRLIDRSSNKEWMMFVLVVLLMTTEVTRGSMEFILMVFGAFAL